MCDDVFHEALNARVQPEQVQPSDIPFSCGRACSFTSALQHQEAILKEINAVQQRGNSQIDPDSQVGKAVLHNLQLETRSAVWIDLPEALKGPCHVAKMLIRKLQDKHSKPGNPYKLNEEQLQCVALYVAALNKGFENRSDVAKPWLHPAEVLLTILMDGGGGCG